MPVNTDQIRKRREAAGLTQAQAAERAKFANQTAWQRVESGAVSNPTLETLERVALALGCTVCDLILSAKKRK